MPRGLALKTLDLIAEATAVLADLQPVTVRGVAYKLFTRHQLPDMTERSVKRVGRALVIAREQGMIPWSWIVDEHREIESRPSWSDPDEYAEAVRRSYRRDRWEDQDVRLLLVSEKGTVRGVLKPVLDAYGVGFLSVAGFASATVAHDLARDSVTDDRPLTLLYVGDHDPSGRFMSDVDLPKRFARYGGQLTVERIALVESDLPGLPGFAAATKRRDPRYKWFIDRFGGRCWELDALDPNVLRDRVDRAIASRIDHAAWRRSDRAEAAELISLTDILMAWQALPVYSTEINNTGRA